MGNSSEIHIKQKESERKRMFIVDSATQNSEKRFVILFLYHNVTKKWVFGCEGKTQH